MSRVALPDGDPVGKGNACSLSESVQRQMAKRATLTGDSNGHGGQDGSGELHVVGVEVDRLSWWWGYGYCVVLCWMDGKRCEEEKRGREEEWRGEAGFVYACEPWWQQRCCATCEEVACWSCRREGVGAGWDGSRYVE